MQRKGRSGVKAGFFFYNLLTTNNNNDIINTTNNKHNLKEGHAVSMVLINTERRK
jgi:hypothetical protein